MDRCIVLFFIYFIFFAEVDARLVQRAGSLFDTLYAREGWVANGLPSINYNIDLGFEYGAVLEFYQYEDRTKFPVFDRFFSFSTFHTTKGASSYQIKWDDRSLMRKQRIVVDAGYFSEQALGFYGFNGTSSVYFPGFEDENDNAYISRMFYRMARNFWNLKVDVQYIINSRTRFFYGLGFQSFEMGSVDIDRMNNNRFMGSALPDTNSLFDQYISWGIIPEKYAAGGTHGIVRLGLVRDTRPVDIAPESGIWSEIMLFAAPSFPDVSDASYIKLAMTHRQYIQLFYSAVFAYRLTYQPLLYGNIPYYAMPFLMFSDYNVSGLGGKNSLRGIPRNRIVGEGYLLGNFELRMTLFHFLLGQKHDVRLVCKPFIDAGMVTRPVQFSEPDLEGQQHLYFSGEEEKLHYTYGIGGHIAINRNFIISADFGFCPDPENKSWGVYLGTGYRF